MNIDFVKRLTVVLAAVIFAGGRLEAAPPWLKLSSANFELFTTAGEGKGREAIEYFERVRGFFVKAMKLEPRTSAPVRIVAFRSEKDYAPYRVNEVADAYYLAAGDRDYIVMKSIVPESYPVAVHEYVHLLVRYSGMNLPPWLNEGMAELYASLKPVGAKMQVGGLREGRLATLRQGRWLPLEVLTRVDQNSPYYNERDRAGIFYAESWILAHMLNLSDDYRPKSPEFYRAILSGQDARAAFGQVYGKTLEQVQGDLMQYVNGSRYTVALFDVKLEKSAEAPAAEEASALDSGMVLAALLSNLGRRAEARAAYNELAKANPTNWQVEEALGYLAMRDRDWKEVRPHFARAAELGGTNPKMYYDYAAILQQGNEKPAVYLPMLAKATELKPDYREAQLFLGYGLLAEQRYGESVAHLSTITKATADEAFPLFRAQAYAYAQLGQKDSAKRLAARARQYARTAEEIAWAERMLQFLDSNQTEALTTRQAARGDGLGDAPRLMRRSAAFEEPGVPGIARASEGTVHSIKGTLERFDCLGKIARIHVLSEGVEQAFAIMDPAHISIRSARGGQVEFSCGAQKHTPVTVTYEEHPDEQLGTVGIVKSLELP